MNKALKHLKTISLHKWYVMIECWKRGLYWQGVVHDLSKFSSAEFLPSARYFQGDKTPIGVEKDEKGYSYAWLNHKAKNKHHWEYWIDFKDGKLLRCPIPEKYVIEMACDMIGASKAYLTGEYEDNEPLRYFLNNESNMLMTNEAKMKLKILLREEANKKP